MNACRSFVRANRLRGRAAPGDAIWVHAGALGERALRAAEARERGAHEEEAAGALCARGRDEHDGFGVLEGGAWDECEFR